MTRSRARQACSTGNLTCVLVGLPCRLALLCMQGSQPQTNLLPWQSQHVVSAHPLCLVDIFITLSSAVCSSRLDFLHVLGEEFVALVSWMMVGGWSCSYLATVCLKMMFADWKFFFHSCFTGEVYTPVIGIIRHSGELRCGKRFELKSRLENQPIHPLSPHAPSLFPTILRSPVLYYAMSTEPWVLLISI